MTDKLLFQSYWVGSRDDILARAERARAAGAKGLIVTLDWVFDSRRDWGSPWIPEKLDLKAMLRYAPQVALKPAYLARWIRSGALPDLGVPNLGAQETTDIPTFFGAYGQWMGSTLPTWEDLAWLREQWGGPFMIKGITRPDDARRAVDIGATAISVSNHGGNNLDSTPATIRCLPGVADAVGDQIEVLLDGGIRRGSDVVKALALGARAVLIGRAYLWGMAANGERGRDQRAGDPPAGGQRDPAGPGQVLRARAVAGRPDRAGRLRHRPQDLSRSGLVSWLTSSIPTRASLMMAFPRVSGSSPQRRGCSPSVASTAPRPRVSPRPPGSRTA